MIVLDRLLEVKKRHHKVLQELLIEIMKTLSTPNLDIRQKTLHISLDLVSPKNIEELILVLKKEIAKTQSEEEEQVESVQYRQMLIDAIHKCAIKYPDIASSVVYLLIEFLSDGDSKIGVEVSLFVRDVLEKYPSLRPNLLSRLSEVLPLLKSSHVYRVVLWCIGHYSHSKEELDSAFSLLFLNLGDAPFDFSSPSSTAEATTSEASPSSPSSPPTPSSSSSPPSKGESKGESGKEKSESKVLKDGTYKTQSALMDSSASSLEKSKQEKEQVSLSGVKLSNVQSFLVKGHFFLSSVIAQTLTKLALKAFHQKWESEVLNGIHARVLLYLLSLIRLGNSSQVERNISSDCTSRITVCLNLLLYHLHNPLSYSLFVEESEKQFSEFLSQHSLSLQLEEEQDSLSLLNSSNSPFSSPPLPEESNQVDDLIQVRLLQEGAASGKLLRQLEMETAEDLNKATGFEEEHKQVSLTQKLERLVQLTGFSDPVYAEAFVNVHQFDILLEITVINQTSDTLQNLTLELSTMGDLKLVERPNPITLSAGEQKQIKANVKVSSTETGIIFGNIVYDIGGASSYAADRNCVILNEIRIDIMDYMSPYKRTDHSSFRKMWSEFEWENKVSVSTAITDVQEFLKHILKCTNMHCLTPLRVLQGNSRFLAANLYAQSIFGEDALANVSVEQTAEGKIVGYIRIRSKTQGIALSLGEKITLKQKGEILNSQHAL